MNEKGGEEMQKRIGMIGIFVKDRDEAAQLVNRYLSDFGNIIVARVGVPYRERGLSVISVIVDGTNEEIGALAGKLGSVPNVTVRSMLAPADQH
jgi:putative iron-only hydrogenase system regulator